MVLFEQRALIILYNAILSAGKRDLYLVPANVCPIIPAAFRKAKVAFELVDIDAETLCIDERLVMDRLARDPVTSFGLLYVRTYGAEIPIPGFIEKVKALRKRTFIIDDKCLCPPDFGPIVSCADLTLYSTGYSKFVDLGWGGFGFLDHDESEYRRMDLPFRADRHEALQAAMHAAIRNDLPFPPDDSDWLGDTAFRGDFVKYRHQVEEAVTIARQRKKQLNAIYTQLLPARIQMRQEFQVWRFSILIPNKAELLRKIFAQGLFASSHYAPLGKVFGQDCDPVARKIHSRIVNLFNDFRFDEEKAIAVCGIIKDHIENGNGDASGL